LTQVNFSGIKADYKSEMMRTDVNGKLDGNGLKRGDFTEDAVTILAPLVVGKVSSPTQVNTLKSLDFCRNFSLNAGLAGNKLKFIGQIGLF
jgi:hypothetical protein